jgi:hypothetical protein
VNTLVIDSSIAVKCPDAARRDRGRKFGEATGRSTRNCEPDGCFPRHPFGRRNGESGNRCVTRTHCRYGLQVGRTAEPCLCVFVLDPHETL